MPPDQAQGSAVTDTVTAPSGFAAITSEIVGAYVANNSVPTADLPALIRSVHDALAGLGTPDQAEAPAAPLRPAVPIKKSVTDEHIISLDDGRKFKSLKRYLAGLGMTPAEYRAKWGLPPDYPMVAPAYAARRSELAKRIGFGRKAVQSMPAPAVEEEVPRPEPEAAAPAPKRGRAKKVG